MKDHLLELVGEKSDPRDKRNVAREYLQANLLRIVHDLSLFEILSFLGGTALRFVHNLPRFSEDLDFSLHREQPDVLRQLLRRAQGELSAAGYDVTMTLSEKTAVHKAFVRFRGLLHEMGISPNASENLSVKIEIDTRPPAGALLETTVIHKFFPLAIRHPDVPSLFAGKIAAILGRPYDKGRDYYDLLWYLTRWPGLVPNTALLTASLAQTRKDAPSIQDKDWKDWIEKKFKSVSWETVQQDVSPFLERPGDRSLLTMENLLKLLRHN